MASRARVSIRPNRGSLSRRSNRFGGDDRRRPGEERTTLAEGTHIRKKKILARLADAADRKQRVSPLDTHKKWPTLRLDFEVTKRDKFPV